MSAHRLVVVANRLPAGAHGTGPGGLVTVLRAVVARRKAAWVGWDGSAGPARPPFEHDGTMLHPVPLSAGEVACYYDGAANGTLWPLYHGAPERALQSREWEGVHRSVNARFAADVMAVTPYRDGMNLVAKEFVAARADLGGALVLSTGAAADLRHAFCCDPHDRGNVADSIAQAAHVEPEEGRRRMRLMRRHLLAHDAGRWVASFLATLEGERRVSARGAGRTRARA